MTKSMGSKLFATLTIFFLAMVSLFLGSCGGGGGSSSSGATPPYIVAALLSVETPTIPNFNTGMVAVKNVSGGSDITNATVYMNGVQLLYNGASGHNAYEGNVTVAPQGAVNVSVTIGNVTYTASGTQFTTYPSIVAPSSGTTWSASTANTIQWTGGSPGTNAAYAFAVLNAADPNGQLLWPANNNIYMVPLSVTSYSIPANSISKGNGIVLVGIYTVTAIPGTTSDSGLVIGGYNAVPITVN